MSSIILYAGEAQFIAEGVIQVRKLAATTQVAQLTGVVQWTTCIID